MFSNAKQFFLLNLITSALMKSKHIFLIVFLIAVLVRLILNFSISLVPGIGGGYNLVQIRAIVEEGHLALPDMPLLFYFNALIVKTLLFLFPDHESKDLIIVVSKIIDSIGLPLLLYPLYRIQNDLYKHKYSVPYLFAVAGFAVLSYSPIDLASDAQKNSLALVFMTAFIYFFLKYQKYRINRDLIFAFLILIITCLTHFGVFVISICFLFLGLFIFYGKKAIIPVIGIAVAGVLLVAVFDPDRALTMVTFWLNAFSIFISPRLIYYPNGIFNYISSFILIWYIISILRKSKGNMAEYNRRVLLLFCLFIIVLSFPFYGFEYGRRLGLMLFVPQSIVLFLLYPYFRQRTRLILSYSILSLIIFTVMLKLIDPKPLVITDEAFADMKNINGAIEDPDKTIIFARHGLEWWVAWEQRVNIALPYVEVNEEMIKQYDQILFLIQKKGENPIYPGKRSIFIKPTIPEKNELVYDSEYFALYALRKF